MKVSLPGFLPRVSNDTHGEKIYLGRKGKWNNPREKKFLERKEWKCNFCNLRKVRNLLFFNGINHRFLSMDRNAISCPRSIYVHRYFFFNIQIFLPVRIIYIFKYETRNWINKNWISVIRAIIIAMNENFIDIITYMDVYLSRKRALLIFRYQSRGRQEYAMNNHQISMNNHYNGCFRI